MNIPAKIIAHSKSSITGKEIVTFELEYPRFIHSELMTHRVFSRNAASSRAIPIEKMIEMVETSPAMPVWWGKNQSGMQAKEEIECPVAAKVQWELAAKAAAQEARKLQAMGLHKQIVNRVLEPFSWMKVVVTSTEWDNWFWLRNHTDAQPEIHHLAKEMLECLEVSESEILKPGEWHVPYYEGNYGNGVWKDSGYMKDFESLDHKRGYSLSTALKISSSLCAQVSYRKADDSVEKAIAIYDRLVESAPVHASPFEHQATPMFYHNDNGSCGWEDGVTHSDKNNDCWSGNFKGYIQHRQLIPNNVFMG